MMTLAWKEVRENLRWALLAMAALGAAEGYALCYADDSGSIGYSYSAHGLGLCHETFLSVTTFGCPLVALLLGLVQILPELRRDQWAALLHRPVSRGTIFRGKVLGGLLLYALATVPPFLFSVWLEATPGHFGLPFVLGTVSPGVADLCTGAVYYFAALALALQRGRWIGWRLLPLLAALHATYYVDSTHLFRAAVTAAVLMSLALFTAGWGIALHQERFAARPWLGRVACLAMLFYGACGLGDLGQSIFRVLGPSPRSRYVEHVLSEDGGPLRVTYDNNVVTAVTDLAGRTPADKKYQPGQVRNHTRYITECSDDFGAMADPDQWHNRSDYRETFRYLTYQSPYYYPQPEQWFYLFGPRIWVGYQAVKKTVIGRLDRRGFVPPSAAPEPFDRESAYGATGDKLILYDRAAVRLASLPRREMSPVPLPASGPVYGVGTISATGPNGENVTCFGVALASELAVFDDEGTPLATLPYHQDVRRWGKVSLGINGTKDRFYLEYEPGDRLPAATKAAMPSYLEERDAAGQVLQTYTLPPLPPFYRATAWSDYVAGRMQSIAFFFGRMGYQKLGALCGSERLANDLANRWGRDRRRTEEVALVISCVALALAAVTRFWTARAGFAPGRAWAWTGFVLGFGPAGFLAFAVAPDWPQFAPCPHCRKPRPIAGETCPHCHGGWPAALAAGTEIFDRAPDPVMAGAPS